MTINLHIGIAHLLPNLIHDISKAAVTNPGEMATVVSRDQWRSYFRPALSQKRKKILELASTLPPQDAFHDSLANNNIAISQHTFLGKGVDFFSSDYSIRDYIGKIRQILDMFEGQKVNIHILIKDQYEYLKSLDEMSINCILQSGQICSPSWSDFVDEIRISAPDAKLIIWDCEEENKIAFAFATWMLDFANDKVMSDMYKFVEGYLKKISVAQDRQELPIPASIAEYLDLRYSLDCDVISKMKGVSFVGKDKVPRSFHVPI